MYSYLPTGKQEIMQYSWPFFRLLYTRLFIKNQLKSSKNNMVSITYSLNFTVQKYNLLCWAIFIDFINNTPQT